MRTLCLYTQNTFYCVSDFLSQFPEPPTGLPTTRGTQPHANNNAPAADGFDFDDLAKRFKELKDRL